MKISYEAIPIEKIHISPFNPRHHVNEKAFRELVESIRKVGVLTPLLVRPNTSARDGYEIAAGHRRYNAAKEIGLSSIPAIIREMNDIEFLEIITIENLQREDVHPLDEAQGYRTLMEKAGYDVAVIAAKVGKSESYVYQRLKLVELIPEAQKAFVDEEITAGHAILIARLQPVDQVLTLKECLTVADWRGEPMSVRELAEHIESEIHLDLNSASFSKKDPDLLPAAGPCTTCPKRAGSQPVLFADIKKKDTCLDPKCFHAKVDAFIHRWIETKSQDTDVPPLKVSGDSNYRAKKIPRDPETPIPANLYHEITDREKGGCGSAREGIVTEGRGKGKVLTVCTDPQCKIHHGRSARYQTSPEELARIKKENQKWLKEEKIRSLILDAILGEAIKTKDLMLSMEDQRFIVADRFHALWDEYRKRIFKRHGWETVKKQYTREFPIENILEKMTLPDLNRLSLEMALISYVRFNEYQMGAGKPLLEVAKRHDIDVKAIEKKVAEEIEGREKKRFDPDAAVKAARRLHKDLEDKAKISKKQKTKKTKLQTPAKKEESHDHGSRIKKKP
jgi:ParB family chromosome partitioning protein